MSINAVKSIKTSAVSANLTKKSKDVGLIFTDKQTVSSAVFTKNKVKAASVLYDMELMNKNRDIRAVIVNSGNANACNSNGIEAIESITANLSNKLNIDKEQIFVASTGIIGENLPYNRINGAMDKLVSALGTNKSLEFAKSIMTTDTFPKENAIQYSLGNSKINIGGVAKGAGMIHPNMGTMLSFIVTDVNISAEILDAALGYAVNHSFNRISVDGDTSTNDTVFIMSTNEADNDKITDENELYRLFESNLTVLCSNLAKMIVQDGEGATKLAEVIVVGAKNCDDAEKIARTVSNSLLVKTALFGKDPNWGRIAAAVGYSNAEVYPDKLNIFIGDYPVFEDGKKSDINKNVLDEYMKNKYIKILIDAGIGTSSYNMWFSDISYNYVKINSEYHT